MPEKNRKRRNEGFLTHQLPRSKRVVLQLFEVYNFCFVIEHYMSAQEGSEINDENEKPRVRLPDLTDNKLCTDQNIVLQVREDCNSAERTIDWKRSMSSGRIARRPCGSPLQTRTWSKYSHLKPLKVIATILNHCQCSGRKGPVNSPCKWC